MSFLNQIFFFRHKKNKNYQQDIYDENDEKYKNKRLTYFNFNNGLIHKLNLNNIFVNISLNRIIQTCSYIYISYYTFINIAMLFRKRNPNIFIIKKKLGGTLGKFYPGGFEPKMNMNEACLILSISNKYNLNQIREAHKKLMLLNHPDFGGSSFIACKINEAKDLLMKNYKKNLKYKI